MVYKVANRPSNKLKIHVESNQLVMYGSSTESSGCVLRGALSLRLKKPSRFVSLALCFYGSISVSWNQCHHTYEFELALPGNLPESTHVAKHYISQYHLKASAQRAGIISLNYTTQQDIHLSRQNFSLGTDYFDPMTVVNVCPGKISYDISMPTKVYGHGDTVPITVRAVLLNPNVQLRYVSCIFKEYVTCRPINGWYSGKNKSYSHMIQYTRQPIEEQRDHSYTVVLHTTIPDSFAEIQCDAQNDSVRVKHKLKFVLSIEDQDGNKSEVKATMPIVVAVTCIMGGLPAYNDIWKTMPYDPVLMMALIRRENGELHHHAFRPIHHPQNSEASSYLPSYSSVMATAEAIA
ncbi:hypothetical protein EDC96DRAFT_446880 [Choanephora cucurbitarum]|nr:hypothetical protein EDC96DRAFT_446880 [Choanephora cucurbitarum]